MTIDTRIYKLAFSFLKGVTAEVVRYASDQGVTPEDFFNLPAKELMIRLNLNKQPFLDTMVREEALANARRELEEIKHHNITPLYLLDEDYPSRLATIEDAPVNIYKLGEAELEGKHIASVVGTRKPSSYGKDFCEKLVKELCEYFPDQVIISGLAYGIDAIAHKQTLECGGSTVAVVAHGLNMIYPAAHRELAKAIIRQGGALISEYPFGVKPFKSNFLERNRIVAALSDVTIVVESAIKGGAMATANFAFSYSRDVMAMPGRISDEKSQGCNLLIRKQKASLVTCAADLIEVTGWKPMNIKVSSQQRNLFPELEGDSKIVYEFLKFSPIPVQADVICQKTKMPVPRMMAALGELEFDGIIIRHPGNRYSIS